MCDAISRQRIEDAFTNFINGEKVFTAFDITKDLRDTYSDFRERHRVVRNMIHSLYESGSYDYDRTLTVLTVNGTDVQAFVYHPTNVLAGTHSAVNQGVILDDDNDGGDVINSVDPRSASDLKKLFNSVNPSASDLETLKDVVNSLFSSSDDTTTVELTSGKRLQIPKHILDKVGGDTVTVKVGGDTIFANRNKDGRVRIGFNYLAPLNKDKFNISIDTVSKEIVIE
jgi:hypothetical protein